MRNILWLLAMILVSFTSCVEVISKAPVGVSSTKIDSTLKEKIDGYWKLDNGVLRLNVLDTIKGIVEAGIIKIEDGKLKPDTGVFYLKNAGDEENWTLVSFKFNDEDKKNGTYHWGRIRIEDNQIIVWMPDGKKIKQLVQNGTLPGKINKDDGVELGNLSPTHIHILCSEEKGVLFEWDEPIILTKIPK